MSDSFTQKRRQQFLLEEFYTYQLERCNRMEIGYKNELAEPDTDKEGASLLLASNAENAYERLSLRYTAGADIGVLRDEFPQVIYAYERSKKAIAEYEQDPDCSPLYFAEIAGYQRIIQLISLCYLLHRRDLLPRIAALQDAMYEGTDTLYEDLLAVELEGRYDVDQWYHDAPYRDIINSLYRDTPEESIRDLQRYVKSWFPAMKLAPWHNSHLRINGTEGDYFGYWAFEAGAVAYLLDLDDSSIDHMIYPKDLVAWARENEALSKPATDNQNGRCEGGQPCPSEGLWFTPADNRPSRYFKQGEIMPEFESTYGSVIWQRQD